MSGQWLLSDGKSVSQIVRHKNPDGSYWLQIGPIWIPNYISGQFGLVWTNKEVFSLDAYNQNTQLWKDVGILPNGNIVFYYSESIDEGESSDASKVQKNIYQGLHQISGSSFIVRPDIDIGLTVSPNGGLYYFIGDTIEATNQVRYTAYLDGTKITECITEDQAQDYPWLGCDTQSDFSLNCYCYTDPRSYTLTVHLNSPKGYGAVLTQESKAVTGKLLDRNHRVAEELNYPNAILRPSVVLPNGDIAIMLINQFILNLEKQQVTCVGIYPKFPHPPLTKIYLQHHSILRGL